MTVTRTHFHTQRSANHFRLCCYVGAGKTEPSAIEGWALFGDIFARRPAAVRYAVVEDCKGNFMAWDFIFLPSSAVWNRGPPEPTWVGPNEEAVTMKLLALYGRE